MCCRELEQRYKSDAVVPSPLQNFGYACQFLSQCLPQRITSHMHQCLNYYLANGLSSPFPLPRIWIRLHGKWLHPYIISALHISVYSTHLALTALIQYITPEHIRVTIRCTQRYTGYIHSQQANIQATPNSLASVWFGRAWN